ncbi:MAG TPA: S41 family peptidase [Steroidobacter sp.]|jgi:carboxyl-terminal processing protease|nr:S41 family peptidase [Steroidobacteraceae bacterium]HLS81682.1 S41 family peptidase [Steroidobacter sp.]
MSRITRPLRYVWILSIGVIAGFSLSLGRTVQAEREAPPQAAATTSEAPATPWRDARLFAEVLEHVRREYVEGVSDQQLIQAAIRGMIADLDPHSAYLAPAEFDEIRISSTGEYSGVGIEVALQDGVVKVVTPIEDTPAERAGVLAGDTILAIDDVAVDVQDLDDTIERMRGKTGTAVKITVARSGEPEQLEFTLSRASVHVNSVRRRLMDDGVGYVRITHFSETTTQDLERALERLAQENGAPLRALALDLRNNPGGVLEAAVGVSDVFLESGLIVSADGRAKDAKFSMSAQSGDALAGAPIAVLVNGGSASASEIVAGALKDHGRATLIGQRTYGKGSVQTVVPLSDGHAIKLTTSRYYTPSGASIHETGIAPDVLVEERQEEVVFGELAKDQELRLAMEVLRNGRPGHGVIRQSRAK